MDERERVEKQNISAIFHGLFLGYQHIVGKLFG